MEFDYLIVGGGSAGCVLANRLSANPRNKVCLIEAGPTDDSLLVRMPAGIIGLMRSNKRNWRYWSAPQKALNNREVYIPRGKTLGGSSAVNAMIYTRGHPWDYDHWEALGNKGWSWKEVLPVFKRSERYEPGEDEFHGTHGNLNVADLRFKHPVCGAFIKAGEQAGHKITDDFNNDEQEGVGFFKVTQKDGERCGVSRGFLHPAMERENLTVLTDALVHKVLFENKTAIGVELVHEGHRKTVKAGKTILAAGAINSPQLLLLSGVGAKTELDKHGIEQIHELPGVGQNLQDHPDALIVHNSKLNDTLSFHPLSLLTTGLREVWKFFYRRQGQMTSNAAEAGGFIKSRDEETIPDLQLHLTAAKLDNHGLNILFAMRHGFSAHVCILRPKSRGSLTLRSADPTEAPIIDPALLEHPDDMEGMVRGVKKVREILCQDALSPWRDDEVFPGKEVQSDEEIRQFLREKCDNIYHPVGTCKMGNDEMAVVDDQLKVHGMENLYVIDASIMPTLIGGNTNAPTVMIAMKAADMLLGEGQ